MAEKVTERCPKCGGEQNRYGTVKRIKRSKRGETETTVLQRLQCKQCKYVHRVLPDDILPYKHYERDVIEGVQEGLIDSNVLGFEDYPCEMTMKRWRSQK